MISLIEQLVSNGIDLSTWSHDQGTKTINDLQTEIDSGESRLEVIEGDLLRSVRVVGVRVYVRLGEYLFRVVEDKQIFFTGAVRQRQLTQLTEKIHPDESPIMAGKRLLQEELGFHYEGDLLTLGQESRRLESASYPGLASCYELFSYEIFLTADDLPKLKFVEVQSHKISLFTLEKCSLEIPLSGSDLDSVSS
jgi:hypothetical protein